MFEVQRLRSVDESLAPVLSGVAFGSFGRPVSFQVTSKEADETLILRFVARRDEQSETAATHVGKLVDDQIALTYTVPGGVAELGPEEPLGLVKLGDCALSLTFRLHCSPDSEVYTLFYEFYDMY